MSKILKVKDLSYNDIFDHLSFDIEKNSVNCIIGANNSGKTTLIRLLSNKDHNSKCIFSDKLSYSSCFYEHIDLEKSGNEILRFNLKKLKNKKSRIEYICKLFDIENLLHKKIKDLKNIDRVKFALAATLISNPDIIYLDNIFDNINYYEYKELMEIIRSIPVTVIFTTNNLENILLCDNVIVLGEKKVFMYGVPGEILEYDNKLSKLGIKIPIMMDLSLKLKCYDLIDEVILDAERLVNILWK